MNAPKRDNIIMGLTFKFSLNIIEYCEILSTDKKYVLSRQLLRSGTSIGANVREAQHAESTPDFIYKIKIAMKEAEETKYWLELCEASQSYNHKPENLLTEIDSIRNIFSKIIITTKGRLRKD